MTANLRAEATSSLKIYLRRGDNKKGATFWQRFFEKPLSLYLVKAALKAGIPYGSVQLGHVGYVPGAKGIASDTSEVPPVTLPVCVELVGTRAQLEAFASAESAQLGRAILVLYDGISLRGGPE